MRYSLNIVTVNMCNLFHQRTDLRNKLIMLSSCWHIWTVPINSLIKAYELRNNDVALFVFNIEKSLESQWGSSSVIGRPSAMNQGNARLDQL